MPSGFCDLIVHGIQYLFTGYSGDGALIDGQMWPGTGLKKSTGTQEHPFCLCSSHWQHRNEAFITHALTAQTKLPFPDPSLALSSSTQKYPSSSFSLPLPSLLLPNHTLSTLSPGPLGSFAEALWSPPDCRSGSMRFILNQLPASLQRLPEEVIHYLGPTWHTFSH